MKLFRPNVMNVIFLAPIAMAASQNGGCSKSADPGPLATKQIEEMLVGNTVQLAGKESYAFIAENGTWRGLNTPSGADSGRWRLADKGILCSTADYVGSKENCDAVNLTAEKTYRWGGGELKVIAGNPKKL
jgi:hypothetical protein